MFKGKPAGGSEAESEIYRKSILLLCKKQSCQFRTLTCHLRWVDQCVSGDTDELAEQVDGELLRGGRGEALQEELQEAGEAVPLQLGLDRLQTFPAVGPIQR